MTSLTHDFELDEQHGADADASSGDVAKRPWLDRISVVRKLHLAVFGNTIVLALVAFVMLSGIAYLSGQGRDQAILASVEVRSNNAAIVLVEAIENLEAAERDGSSALGAARTSLSEADALLNGPLEFAGEHMPVGLGGPLIGFRDRLAEIERSLATSESQRELADIRSETEALYDDVASFAFDLHDTATAKSDALFQSISRFLFGFVILVLGGIGLSLIATRRLVLNVASRIREITKAMQSVAGGDSETEIPGRENGDEIGDMARALAVFREDSLKLRDLNSERASAAERELTQQQELAEKSRALRVEKSELLEGMADSFEVTVGEVISAVSAASTRLKETSQTMNALAEGSAEQSRTASGAMESTTQNLTAAAAATDQFALSIAEISKQATASAALARDASELVTTANTRMTDLSSAAEEIGEIVELIQTIAQRTNLLALNASIEAARGGEAGRGFAVVASEVKELANQTSNATASVTERIQAMQSSTGASVADLTSIVRQIDELEKASVVIAAAVDEQSTSGEELARNIDTVANGSTQVAGQLDELREASLATGNASGEVLESADELEGHAEALRNKATRFLEDLRRSSRELESDDAELVAREAPLGGSRG